MNKLERQEILEKAKERLMEMEFERKFYQMLYEKTNTIQYLINVQRLEADMVELSDEISLF